MNVDAILVLTLAFGFVLSKVVFDCIGSYHEVQVCRR